ncbi:hypothetical protein [Falsiroseomonas sp.]|uniref:hypothetical protein n=1 Tax=Falsiroseomonas sp. TaxID=2870721 RepID=UPI0027325098|nr:hypothetical protein [Falsiroseomonas sp.]MDP3415347.1 hypothetical protein [Falsiroseomonas sp.]
MESLTAESDQLAEFTSVHNIANELETLVRAVNNRPELVVYEHALQEFQFSLYAAAGGSYRHAHISLRLCFELFSAGVLFSAHEIKLRNWLSGAENSDVNWGQITHPETGIFSTFFVRSFNSELSSSAKQYQVVALKVYRECSEFVHGNVQTHGSIGRPIEYNADLLRGWADRVKAARICIIFAFAGRYLALLENTRRNQIESIMTENLGHLPAVRAAYS